jgi:hypothetical protein
VYVSLPVNSSVPPTDASVIAGSVLPIQRAEELLGTLPGVISVRIVASPTGAVEEIHLLTTTEFAPKQTVRNVESALMAHLGMRVSHKKISVATSSTSGEHPVFDSPRAVGNRTSDSMLQLPVGPGAQRGMTPSGGMAMATAQPGTSKRRIYFEDVEVRRSRSKGVACRVTLRKGDESYVGEAEGLENERLRIELAARATLSAIRQAEGEDRALALEGCRLLDAFDREFVFVGVTAREGRDTALMTGSAEVRESAETASVLAVLDATNRWLEFAR